MSAIAASSPPTYTAEQTDVLAPIEQYFLGHARDDASHMRQAFLPTAHIESMREGVFTSWPLEVYCERFKATPAADEASRRRSVDWIDVGGDRDTTRFTPRSFPPHASDAPSLQPKRRHIRKPPLLARNDSCAPGGKSLRLSLFLQTRIHHAPLPSDSRRIRNHPHTAGRCPAGTYPVAAAAHLATELGAQGGDPAGAGRAVGNRRAHPEQRSFAAQLRADHAGLRRRRRHRRADRQGLDFAEGLAQGLPDRHRTGLCADHAGGLHATGTRPAEHADFDVQSLTGDCHVAAGFAVVWPG